MNALRAFATALLLAWAGVWAPPAAAFTGHVFDMSHGFDAPQQQALDAQLGALEQQKGRRVVAVVTTSLFNGDPGDFARLMAHQYETGRPGGLLILIVQDSATVHLEGEGVPEGLAERIAHTTLQPAIARGDFTDGILRTVQRAVHDVLGEDLPSPEPFGERTLLDWWRLVAHTLFFGMYPAVLAAGLFGGLPLALPVPWRHPWQIWLACAAMGLLAFLIMSHAAGNGFDIPVERIVVGCIALALLSGRLGCRALHRSRQKGGSVFSHYGGSGGSGSSDGSSSSSSSYSSGGGGDYGGGGASGKW